MGAEIADLMVTRYEVDLSEADLHGANLNVADLSLADLRNADISVADLRAAEYDGNTKWPEGFDPEEAGAVKVDD